MFALFLSLFFCLFVFQFGLKVGKKHSWKFCSEMSDVQLETTTLISGLNTLLYTFKKNSFSERKEKVPSVG